MFITAMSGDPRTLDPVRVGDTTSNGIASNIHDTPYQYHYLKRPLQLIPSMATGMPVKGTTRLNGKMYPTFRFQIKKGLHYADDPCFGDGKGREILADDIIFSIKRAADRGVDPFGYPLLSTKVVGFDEYADNLEKARSQLSQDPDALRSAFERPIPGVLSPDPYSVELVLTEDYPQVIYFFSLSVGSPVPAECYFHYDGKDGRQTYDRHPVASGPFYLKDWHPNYRIVLARNPNYRKEDYYPEEGNPGDRELGLLKNAGKQLPIADEIRMYMIQAGPTIWTLFEQGYLDRAGIPREVFDQVIQDQGLSERYEEMGIRLDRDADVATFWWYFNMDDPVLGKNRKLRKALSLILDRKEMINRFFNNRGIPAQGLVPPGIEGYEEDYQNPWANHDLAKAKALLAEAGYPGGIDPVTGKPLRINLTLVNSPGATSLYRFYVDQFAQANVELNIEELDWPTVLEKKANKTFQMIHGGWHADYPDPQNFYQLFYGPNVSSSYNENNYQNPEFDRLYNLMNSMEPGPERMAIIRKMRVILGEDVPVIFMYHPVSFGLTHSWVAPLRPHPINTNQLKFRDMDPRLRKQLAAKWNAIPPSGYLVLGGIVLLFAYGIYLAVRQYNRMGR